MGGWVPFDLDKGRGDKKRFRTSLFTLANEAIATQPSPVLNNSNLLGQSGMKAGIPTLAEKMLFGPEMYLILLLS